MIPICGGQWITTDAGIFMRYCTHLFIIIVFSAGAYQLIEMPARKFLLKISPIKLFCNFEKATVQ